MSIIKSVDDLTFNFISSAKEAEVAIKYKDESGAVHAAAKHALGYAQLANYTATGAGKGVMISNLITKHSPFAVNAKVIHFLQGLTTTQLLAGIGIVVSSLLIIVNSISIHRQNEVLSVIPGKEQLKNDETLVKTLDALDKVNYNHFKSTLPEHLKARIDKLGGENALGNLKSDVVNGSPEIGRRIVSDIQEYAAKKRITHILTLIGGIVSLTVSIGLLVGCPPLALTLLAIVGLALTISSVVMSKGWVENNKDGFNWKLCLPEFIQKKLTIDKEFESELSELTVKTSAHNSIIPQLHMLQMGSAPSEEDIKAFTAPLAAETPETEKVPTRWEKFKMIFKREEKAAIEIPKALCIIR